MSELLRLYPLPPISVESKGIYLSHSVQQLGTRDKPFVYANFLSSLDGRIALEDSELGETFIPKHLTTTSDFSLFMELHAQADCLITHGGYLRALQQNKLGNILQVKEPALIEWRKGQGLKPQPDIVIASASLDFPIHASLKQHGQTVYIATGDKADANRLDHWRQQGYEILLTGAKTMVEGKPLIDALSTRHYQSIYLIAGPQMLDAMVRDRQLARIYLTMTHQLIGGTDFRSLLTGSVLGDCGQLHLESLYYEAGTPVGSGQFFMQFGIDIEM
jgi:riboflavin biosynthesis pyrimidine reductase